MGPAASYYFVGHEQVHPFVRASANWARSSFDNSVVERGADNWALAGGAGLLLMVSEAVGVEAELFVTRSFAESPLGDEFETTTGGLRFGVAAFVL